DSGKEKLVSILNKLSSIHDDEVKKAVAKKIGTADDHQQRLNKRKKDKSLMMVQRYLQYCELSQILPKGKTKNAGPGFDQIMAMGENSMKEAESLGADKKSLSELRKQIDEIRKMQMIFDAEAQVEGRTKEANKLRAKIKKKYDKPEKLIDIHSLDQVKACYAKEDNMIVISGSWEAGYPCVLERAEHIFKDGGVLVSLYWKPYFNSRGQTSTSFAVRIPVVGKAPQVISVNGPREARKLSVTVQDKPMVFNNWSLVVDSQRKGSIGKGKE
ncbi:MAG: hypothetical protein J7M40_11985, partial [Planctomycetes bacterium]|nr:hypothetical protein [Planctomycetota bacterium]